MTTSSTAGPGENRVVGTMYTCSRTRRGNPVWPVSGTGMNFICDRGELWTKDALTGSGSDSRKAFALGCSRRHGNGTNCIYRIYVRS
jgi:hypothetical protein